VKSCPSGSRGGIIRHVDGLGEGSIIAAQDVLNKRETLKLSIIGRRYEILQGWERNTCEILQPSIGQDVSSFFFF
jgi:hypothetical protein